MRILTKIAEWSESRVRAFGARYVDFGIFSVINYIIPMYMWSDEHSGEFLVYSIRIVAILLSFLLAVSETLPANYHKYRPLLWHFTVMFCQPFFVTLMIWHEGITFLWVINCFLAVLLGFILLDLVSFSVLYSLGAVLGTIVALFLGYSIRFDMPDYLVYPSFYMCIFAFAIVIIFSRDLEKKRSLQLTAMKALASTVAHEVRTPLASISMMLKSMVLKDKNLTDHQIEKYNEKRQSALAEIANIFSLIDLMLMKVSIFNRNCVEVSHVHIEDLINEAVQRYVREKTWKQLVHVDIKDNVVVNINRTLMLHVLFNLIQNAEYQIKAEGKGEIYISAGSERKWSYLTIRDTASGIHPSKMKSIFEPFVTFKPQGTGLGLSFCKTVVESMSASIECRSEYGEYTEFTIKF